jgi:hypothetical protein
MVPLRTQYIQTHIGGNPKQQAGGKTMLEALPLFDHSNKNLLHGIQGLLFISEEAAASPEHHGSVTPAILFRIDFRRFRVRHCPSMFGLSLI